MCLNFNTRLSNPALRPGKELPRGFFDGVTPP
jgi:hypothetical protein